MDTEDSHAAAPKRSSNPAKAVAITIACIFVFEALLRLIHPPDYRARVKRTEALLADEEERSRKYTAYLQRVEDDQKRTQSLIDQQEQANARFQQILDTWERQQKEYQTYLDSLKKPK